MKGMPLPCEFQRVSSDFLPPSKLWSTGFKEVCFVGTEPTSVLDTTGSPSPPTSSSTSLGTAAMTTAITQFQTWHPQPQDASNAAFESSIPVELDTVESEKPAMGMDDWVSVLMGDAVPDFVYSDSNGASGFGSADDGNFIPFPPSAPNPPSLRNPNSANAMLSPLLPVLESVEERPGRVFISHHQIINPQTPPFFSSFPRQPHLFPSPKRQNSGSVVFPKSQPYLDSGQGVIDDLFMAAEMAEMGNLEIAQGILARLNHQLSPVGSPFIRAAFHFREALKLLLHRNITLPPPHSSSFDIIHKIGAYKCFSEISPVLQFANFTCTQALVEALEGSDRIHILDFDLSYGSQWASLMKELASRNRGAPFLKITAFISPTNFDELELALARETLIQFASEINMAFELDITSIDFLNSHPFVVSEHEALAVNLPMGSNHSLLLLPSLLRFVKGLTPKIVVSVDKGHERSDLSFAQRIIYSFRAHCAVLESLDAMNANLESVQKIERFLLCPEIERIVAGVHPEKAKMKAPHWRNVFLGYGFSALELSNVNESQADCVVKRSPVRGFHVEKRHSSLVLYWKREELISVSAWRCS